ncbi:MAG: DUF4391 domain-containing protein [Paludibacteraceae bacterium]|nr:DUF4391 domain-containing protein [Paludibacteraceae bacterium]
MIDNLLKYPSSCLVGKVVPKTTFQRHLDTSTSMKRHFQDDVVSIIWLYKIAPTTLQVQGTDDMREIQIFLADLKDPTCPADLFTFIDKHMPQYIVFLLRYQQQYRLLINYKEWADMAHTHFNITQSFCSEWLTSAQLSLPITGTELPTIYEYFVRYVAGQQLISDNSNLHNAVLSYQEQETLKKRLATLQAQIAKEMQPKRKFELHQQIVELQKKLK